MGIMLYTPDCHVNYIRMVDMVSFDMCKDVYLVGDQELIKECFCLCMGQGVRQGEGWMQQRGGRVVGSGD